MTRNVPYFAAGLAGVGCLFALVSCGSNSEAPLETVGKTQAAIYSLDDPTTVSAGTPSARTASCPQHKLPDQCGSWAGVELVASRSYWPPRSVEGEHCLCQPIEFQIPASLPVTRGNAGVQSAELEFRKSNGHTTRCTYRGDLRLSKGKLVGGEKYDLQFCTDGAKAGSTAKADWFSLEVEGGNPFNGPTEVQLRLGEPDVVDGVVQEQVFFSNDSRIPGGALHVPRGSAPPLQGFSLDVLPQVVVGSTINNGGAGLKTAGYAVNVHAVGVDNFAFTPVAGAACPRIDLPYNPTTLASIAGPGAEGRLLSRQITNLAGVATGDSVLAPTGPLSVDPVQHTASFCVEHLSYYVAGVNAVDGNLTGAYLAEGTPASCTTTCTGGKVCIAGGCYYNVLSAPPPPLAPNTDHTLRLEFTNETIAPWTSSNLKLTSVQPRGGSTTPTPLAGSPWFPGLATPYLQAYAGGSVGQAGVAAFTVSVKTPLQETPYASYAYGSILNLCLQLGTTWISECFSFDPGLHPTTTSGTTAAPLAEVCDGIDNDGNGIVDDGPNPCGGICPLSPAFGTACDNGEKGVCLINSSYVCNGRNATRCGAGSGAGNATSEICGNGIDEDCSGTPDDGACCVPGSARCVGTNGTFKQSCGPDGTWVDSGIVVGECNAECNADAACGQCGNGTRSCADGRFSGSCSGGDSPVDYYSDADGDAWCTTSLVSTCPANRPANTRTLAECSDSTWGFRADCLDSNGFVQNGCCEKLIYGPDYYKVCCGGPEVKTFDYDCGEGWHVQSCSLTRIEGFGKTSHYFSITPDSCTLGERTGSMGVYYALDLAEGVEGYGVVHCVPDGLSEQPRTCPIQ